MPAKRKTDPRNDRPDHQPGHRQEYERNRKKILASQTVCAICGRPVDRSLKFPHPWAATVDHIVPVTRGGHPSDISNLQLAHFRCNRWKYDRIQTDEQSKAEEGKTDHYQDGRKLPDLSKPRFGLPWSIDWTAYRYDPGTHESNSAELAEKAERIRETGFQLSIEGITPNR